MNSATASPIAPEPEPKTYLNAESGIRSWLFTHDHKRIGLMFFVATTMALMLGGFYAMLLRIELLTPGPTIVDAQSYNRFFTLHGIIMVFMFLIPAVPAIFGNFLLPIMIGARDVAFPRLNLASFYFYLAGSCLVLWSMFDGGLDTGWTFYTPYSLSAPNAVISAATGIVIIGFSSIATGLNFIVTVHTMRAKGMGWMKLPLFVWSTYATAIIQVLATPVLGMSLIIVAFDRAFHVGLFDPALGGDPVLFQHLFWFYSHPAVYIMVLPAMGVVSELIPGNARKNPYSYKAIAYSSVGIGLVGFLTWGHHLFVAGISTFSAGAFGILSMLVAIFSAIKVFTWVATLYRGSVEVSTSLIYAISFLFLFIFGGMTGVAVASTSLDVHWHDTYFVVAHFHFIMVGGSLTGYLGALHWWFPKITGRLYSERVGLLSSALVFGGFVFTFFPQFLLGNAGMPRRYYSYPPEFQTLHVASTAGASILALGMAITLANILVSTFYGKRAGPNPWGVRGLEWRTSSPPPQHNFDAEVIELPDDYDPYDYYRTEPGQ